MSDEGASPVQALLGAARQNNLELLKLILSQNNTDPEFINSRDPLGYTALHQCCKYGSLECLDFLLDQETIDLDALTNTQDTPLHLAVQCPHEAKDMVEFLIDAGASSSIRNKNGDKASDLCRGDVRDAIATAEAMNTIDVVDEDDIE